MHNEKLKILMDVMPQGIPSNQTQVCNGAESCYRMPALYRPL